MTAKEWLRKSVAADIRITTLSAAGAAVGALVVLFITFVLVYAILGLVFGILLPSADTLRVLTALVVVGLLFVGNARAGPDYLASLSGNTSASAADTVGGKIPGGARIPHPPPDSARSFLRLLASIVYSGPRAANLSFRLFAKARRLKSMDFDGCAAVIALLYSRNSRWTYQELERKIPQLPWNLILYQLKDVDGIIFFTSDPPGLTLADRLREELRLMSI
ncbi:MAG: hypothetical protein NTW87_23645 [Planctomycetota bacterium]|nr:hypothetical protein [Planctomycetota bacterium]